MSFVFYTLGPLVVLGIVLLAGIVAVAVIVGRPRGELEEGGPPGQAREALKRLYLSGAAFVSLMVAASGATLVGRYVLDALFGPVRLVPDEGALALGLVLGAIWTPSWLWHWGRLRALARETPATALSLPYQLHLHLTLTVALAFVALGVVDGLRQAFGAQDFRSYPLAGLAVWGLLWAYHCREATAGPPALRQGIAHGLYLHGAAAAGLAMLSVGLGTVLALALREAYDSLFQTRTVLAGEAGLWEVVRGPLAVALGGAILWPWHWAHSGERQRGQPLRQFYLYAFALLGGAAVAIAAAATALYGTLAWALGATAEAAGPHFRSLPGAVSALLVGVALWAYHWLVAQREQEEAAARRTYDYLLTAQGLGALVAAILLLVATLVALATEDARGTVASRPGWWRDDLALLLTLALVGVPVWWYHWWRRQRAAASAQERASLARRLFLYGSLALAVFAALGGLSHLLYLLVNTLLEADLSARVAHDGRWSLGVLAAAACWGPYHWLALLEDRRRAPEEGELPPAKLVTVLVGEDGGAFVEALEALLGQRVRVLRRADPGVGAPSVSPEGLQSLAGLIAAASGRHVLVVADAQGVQVYSYR